MSEEPRLQPPSQPPASTAVIESKQMPSSAEPGARPQRGGASFKEYMLRIAEQQRRDRHIARGGDLTGKGPQPPSSVVEQPLGPLSSASLSAATQGPAELQASQDMTVEPQPRAQHLQPTSSRPDVRSWLSALPGGRGSVTTIDSNASQSMRLPIAGVLGSTPVSPPPRSGPPPAMPAAVAGAPSGTGVPSSAAAQLRPPCSGFLVQQPSSKLWMEAVPMRTGVKASKSYRVYSNAFMEGRPQSETGPRNYLRPGIPSIHPGTGGPQSTAMTARRQAPQGMQPSLPRSLAEQAMQLQRAAGPPVNLAPFSIQRTMSGKQLKGANAAAKRMQKGYSVTMPKEESGAAPGAAGTEGRQGSAGSNEGNSGSRSKDPSSGETEAISEPQPPLLQRQMQEAQQQQQLAALLMMQEAAGGFPGSLLSSGSAQGSSNLIYLLKSLQEQGSSNPQALLQQLQASAQGSPRQQAMLIRMLQESMMGAAAREPLAARESVSSPDVRRRFAHPVVQAADPPAAPDPPRQARRVEPDQARLAEQSRLAPKRPRAMAESSISHSAHSGDAGPSGQTGNAGRVVRQRVAHPSLESPKERTAAAGEMQRVVFSSGDPSTEENPVNPFEDVRRQPEAAQSRHAQSAPPAAALSTGATGAPFGDPAKMRLEDMPPLQQPAPVVGGNPESLRQAAETLLCLTSMDPAPASAPPPAPAARTPSLGELTAANVAERGPEASPLQALVQDIMREQQQRHAATQVADGSAAEEAGPAAEARRSPVAFSPSGQAPPLGRRMSRYPAAERTGSESEDPAYAREGGATRHPLLGVAVPHGRRSGAARGAAARQPTASWAASGLAQGEELGPRRSGGSSSGYTEGRGDPSPRPPSSGHPAARGRSGYSHSGRRVTYASHPDFEDAVSEEASQEGYQSPDSESWDAKKGSRRGQR